ncbi:hypothetical protein B0P06_000288 [Clostridium saccharoperbutylacetonicum]|uniref:Uncharacterized protein n=1 Tax=Clostridium saccharoperbutylacetonicum N1-4(HMT) TaxID=931276 RepID=M1MCG7_9CLOT|nr:hypothetical protein [Clostridium saccharoperbutylacetonicum]AGF55609.1 hypothetical protein Cspa_c18390 [Clostridium saccharoperbutylacetonicum N1-4(HMT)]NRT63670.1 hypothetical protein [Clostridium saccharoperbutylacetonicum]NSB27033.1 hypothetical protein [Clostridium saccharoperbutylacetonicum]NSB40517.1 hypothetical protein [Clostridium saccharoperbutylacetonicum]
MAKILGSTAIGGNISKMIETPDYFLINGQVYDKNTLSPDPFDFCPVTSSALNEMSLAQTAYVNGHWERQRTTNGYMIDSTDPSTCYVATQGTFNSSTAGIYKLTKNANGTWTNTPYTDWGGSYSPFIDMISQDSQKIYYTIHRMVGGGYVYIGQLNKTTMKSTYTNLVNVGAVRILKDTDMYIYFTCSSVNETTINVGKYDKVANTVSWLLADKFTAGNFYNFEASDIDNNGVFYSVRDGLGMGMSDHYVGIRKFVLDTSKDTIIASNVTLDTSLYPNGKIPLVTGAAMGVTHTLLRHADSGTGKNYMTHIIYNGGTSGNYTNAADSALYTYEIVDDINWKLVSYTSFNPVIYRTCLPILNNQTIILAYESGCHIYVWDSGTTSYKKVSSFDSPIGAVGIDSNNNIYIQYADTSIEMISNVMPITVFADFQEDVYNYNGTDISTNIVAYVKNYQGKYLPASIQINLYGNCKFTDDGKRTKTVTTTNLDKLTIPVTIYDTGNLRVSVKIL